MKRYFCWDDEDYIGGTTYIEIGDGYETKQIAVTPNKYIALNRKDKEHHFYLAEGLVDTEEIIKYGGSEISEQYFYGIWNTYKSTLIDKWKETKERFPLGDVIEGIIEVFYSQGIVINISQDVIGITDDNKSSDSTNPKNLYPEHKIIGKVASYDEDNMWLVIENLRVF